MNVSLTPQLERFTRSLVESGRYRSASEVLREALRLLEDREAQAAELRAQMQQALESGPARPFDREELRGLVRARVSELAAEVERGEREPVSADQQLPL